MKSRLTNIQVDYVLDHIAHHVVLDEALRSRIAYGEKPLTDAATICFPAAEDELDLDKVIRIDTIPVLYPVKQVHDSFYGMEDHNLCFHHDLLKSIFHLLSGYEEIKNGARDEYGRFPYAQSLQCRLKIIDKPVVNYYIEIIVEGLRLFCDKNRIPFHNRPLLNRPVLMLSHDVDLINAYDFKETAYKFKQLLGLAPSPFRFKDKIRDAYTALYHFLNPFSQKNPFWSFEQLMSWEAERGIRSSYYFLEKDGSYDNSRYRFHYKKIRKLIRELSAAGHEIGIHGTMQSFDNLSAMQRTVEHLREVSPEEVSGIRQHYLRFKPGHTAQIQFNAGLRYDASLGFSEYEGFRNSYCWPFRFFDFQKHRSMDFWEIPLTFMDVTHFYHRELKLEESARAIGVLAAEVARFNGVFSLLWHNSFFNEREFPGITAHYTGILDQMKALGMEGITGKEIIGRMTTGEDGGQER